MGGIVHYTIVFCEGKFSFVSQDWILQRPFMDKSLFVSMLNSSTDFYRLGEWLDYV